MLILAQMPAALPSPILRRLSSTRQRHVAPGSAGLQGEAAAAGWAARKSRAPRGGRRVTAEPWRSQR